MIGLADDKRSSRCRKQQFNHRITQEDAATTQSRWRISVCGSKFNEHQMLTLINRCEAGSGIPEAAGCVTFQSNRYEIYSPNLLSSNAEEPTSILPMDSPNCKDYHNVCRRGSDYLRLRCLQNRCESIDLSMGARNGHSPE